MTNKEIIQISKSKPKKILILCTFNSIPNQFPYPLTSPPPPVCAIGRVGCNLLGRCTYNVKGKNRQSYPYTLPDTAI